MISNSFSETGLKELKGIGDKTEKLFVKAGICNLDQLVHYYPRSYEYYAEIIPFSELRPGIKQTVAARVNKFPVVKKTAKVTLTVLNINDITGSLEVVWFNMPYLRTRLKSGSFIVLRGMVTRKGSRLVMEQPEIFSHESYKSLSGSIRPVYSLTAGLKNKVVLKAVLQIFERYSFIEYLPMDIIEKYSLAARETALHDIHFPSDRESLLNARKRLVFDEFLFFILKIRLSFGSIENKDNNYPIEDFSSVENIISHLEFKLTSSQIRALEEICSDLGSSHVMNRLLQGDVGSGKTIISFLIIILMMKNGYQSALMAPTEILAIQHYKNFKFLLESNGITSENVLLLTGSLSQKAKRQAYNRIASGQINVVIGTHAIIQENVIFKNLGLVITDEQHRFGVRQRKIISEKGCEPNILVMSATPIPRTLALILYSDLDISVLNEMPSKRLRIKNCVVDYSYRNSVYAFIKKEINSGHQAYVICPMIEHSDEIPCENVIDYTLFLKKIFPPEVKVEMLHGKMTPAEKNDIMKRFSNGLTDILVSTTVVEVGVDVPNATVMVIENAERFGLASLHQLRGRIGRGEFQSYCIFIKRGEDDLSDKRLEIVSNSNNGFYIAQEDMMLRGHGDLLGFRQSGFLGFTIADPLADASILEMASIEAELILSEDPQLASERNSLLKEALLSISTSVDGVL